MVVLSQIVGAIYMGHQDMMMNSIQGEILTSEVCVSVKRSGDLAKGRRDV
jgi:hypothetical protein